MNSIYLGLITLAFIVAVGVFVAVMIELRSAVRSMNEFLKTTESTLKPTLEELRETLKSLRGVTENMTAVTEDIKSFSASFRDMGESVKLMSELFSDLTTSTVIKVSGFRAALRAAAEVLVKGLVSGKDRG